MRSIYVALPSLASVLCFALFGSCAPLAIFQQDGAPGQEPARTIVAKPAGGPAQITVRVSGISGEVIAGALVTTSVNGAPGPAGRTNGAGLLRLSDAAPGAYVVKVARHGFAENIRAVAAPGGSRTLVDIPLTRYKSQAVDLARNVKIVQANIQIEIPANTFVDARGRAAKNGVVRFRSLDVRGEELRLMPGDFRGVFPDEAAKSGAGDSARITEIESFGAASITVVDPAGEELRIAPGKFLILRLPFQAAGDAQEKAPADIPLWSMDEERGLWMHEGEARTRTIGSRAWTEAKLPHLSWWNIDRPIETKHSVWVQSFVNEAGEHLFVPTMSGRGLDYNGISFPYSYYGKDNRLLPGACIDVKADSKVRLNFQYADESGLYEAVRAITSGAGGSSCRLDPAAGTVVQQFVLKKLPTTCVRGTLDLKGLSGDRLRLELNAFGFTVPDSALSEGTALNHRSGLLYIGDLQTNGDGRADFCVDNAPIGREAWLFAIDTDVKKNLEGCDEERYASFRLQADIAAGTNDSGGDPASPKGAGRSASCARNSQACMDVGTLRGRLAQSRCVASIR